MQTIKNSRKLNAKKITGQGMSEYLIIVGLIAVAGIAAMGFLGNIAKSNVSAAAQELSGADGTGTINHAATVGNAAATEGSQARTLNNFGSHQDLNDGL